MIDASSLKVDCHAGDLTFQSPEGLIKDVSVHKLTNNGWILSKDGKILNYHAQGERERLFLYSGWMTADQSYRSAKASYETPQRLQDNTQLLYWAEDESLSYTLCSQKTVDRFARRLMLYLNLNLPIQYVHKTRETSVCTVSRFGQYGPIQRANIVIAVLGSTITGQLHRFIFASSALKASEPAGLCRR